MNKIFKVLVGFVLSIISGLSAITFVYAAAIDATTAQAGINSANLGGIGANLCSIFTFLFNFFVYVGWAGVFLGIALAIFGLIYKLFSGDSEEAVKQVQSYLTKAVIIVVAGLLLLSIGFIVNLVSDVMGYGAADAFCTGLGAATGGASASVVS